MRNWTLGVLAFLLMAAPASAVEYTSQGGVVLRASGDHSTSKTIQFVNDGGYCGAYLYWECTTDDNSAIVTVLVEIVELAGGAVVTMKSFADTIAETEEKIMQIGTQVTVASGAEGVDEVMVRNLPYRFNILLTHTDADVIVYSASIQFTNNCPG